MIKCYRMVSGRSDGFGEKLFILSYTNYDISRSSFKNIVNNTIQT